MGLAKKNKEIHVRVYDDSEHAIKNTRIDTDARNIIGRLKRRGYKAYVVGGAVRDLLLGITPKDYDIATDATPQQIRRSFSNCRIIGKRFRLIHVYFPGDKIIEVATFRSTHDTNVYGRIEEDALRRDFTINALYYEPDTRYLIDYVGGYRDLRAGKLVPVIPLNTIFSEDPVRMIRAVKYSVGGGMTIVRPLARAIQRDARLLDGISYSRLTEEFIKIILSGNAQEIFTTLHSYRLLQYLQPRLNELFRRKRNIERINDTLSKMDERAREHRVLHGQIAGYLPLFSFDFHDTTKEDRLAMAKKAIAPVTPPNSVISRGIEDLYRPRQKPGRPPRPRQQRNRSVRAS